MTWNMPKWKAPLTWAALLAMTCHPPPRRPLCPTGGLQMFLCGSRRRRGPAELHPKRKRSLVGAGSPGCQEGPSLRQPIFTMRRPTATRSEKSIAVCGALGRGGRRDEWCESIWVLLGRGGNEIYIKWFFLIRAKVTKQRTMEGTSQRMYEVFI